MKPRYLTKSRFQLAMECPTKLYYIGKKDYADSSVEDPFLLALAEGGFQVGELAKLYYPGGVDIVNLDYEESLAETNELLNNDSAIIYEAAIKHDSSFIRVDILVKEGNRLDLIEVKSKSISDGESMVGRRGGILSGWKSYVEDVAFQKHVVQLAFPHMDVHAHLMLVDKDALCPTDGLNQKFKIVTDERGRKSIHLSEDITEEDLSVKLLRLVDANELCDIVYEGKYEFLGDKRSFSELVEDYARSYKDDLKIAPKISRSCGSCEFKASERDLEIGLKSGYRECFKEALGWKDNDFEKDSIFDVWNLHHATRDRLISQGRLLMDQLEESDMNIKEDDKPGISASQRRWLQVDKYNKSDKAYWIDKENLKVEMDSWVYPLHFIDFETAQPAIPFNKGLAPYGKIAFQFSHHVVYEDGTVEHKGEYLNTSSDSRVNYDFVRALKDELDKDQGTIFKYSNHENTYLNAIYDQLEKDEGDIVDRDELLSFIREVTEYGYGKARQYGPRNMVDMLELVKRFYYDPYMKGSNSIKAVLPAVLNSSDYLKDKYSKPIYGLDSGIRSLNYKDWVWIKEVDGEVVDPYLLLPKMFDDISQDDFQLIGIDEELRDGGAAMMAYYKLQFEDIEESAKDSIAEALLRYCELDTLAMVMIYEAWREMLR